MEQNVDFHQGVAQGKSLSCFNPADPMLPLSNELLYDFIPQTKDINNRLALIMQLENLYHMALCCLDDKMY